MEPGWKSLTKKDRPRLKRNPSFFRSSPPLGASLLFLEVSMLNLSEKAAQEILNALSQMEEKGLALRLSARKRPNTGMVYNMGFDEPKNTDLHYQIQGVDIIVDAETDQNVAEMVIDYAVMDGTPQFIFANPNDSDQASASSCSSATPAGGCGTGCSCG